jgi:hypothetical protein
VSELEDSKTRATVLDVLIAEHRERTKATEQRLTSIHTLLGTVATGVVALLALIVPRLPYDRFHTAATVLLGVAGVAALGVIVVWVDAVGGPLRRVFRPYREAVEKATEDYDDARPLLDPIIVRTTLLDRLITEEALALRALEPQQNAVKQATILTSTVLIALQFLAVVLIT